MRVALDVGPLKPHPAGVGIYVRSLACALNDILGPGKLAFIGRRRDAAGLPAGIESSWRPTHLPYPAWALLQAGAAAASSHVDVVHTTDGLAPLVRRANRTVTTVLDLTLVERWRDHRPARYARIPFVLAAPRLATAVIVPSKATADAVIRFTQTRAGKIHIVPLAARTDFAPAERRTVDGACARYGLAPGRYVLVPGTIEPRKNPIGTLHAFGRLVSNRAVDDDIRLVYAGSPGWRSGPFLAALAASAVRERVDRLGYVADEDLAALMSGAAAVAYPSFAEGFGLPVLEAMACGAVVVTSDCSSLPEVAGDAAILVDPADPGAIADGLRTILDSGATERAARTARSIARAAAFSWSETARSTLGVYEATRRA